MKQAKNATFLQTHVLLTERMPFVLPTTLTASPDTAVRKWAISLPQQIEIVSQQWGIATIKLHHATIHSLICTGQQNQKTVFLKCVRSATAFRQETIALRFFASAVAPTLEMHSPFHIFLIEAIKPGTPLDALLEEDEEKACTIFADVLATLHTTKSPPALFTPLTQFKSALLRAELPQNLAHKGIKIFDHLISSTEKAVALYGDLHGQNILKSAAGWCAIDPKGYVGDPAFELNAFIRNPQKVLAQNDDAGAIMQHQAAFISEKCNQTPARVIGWVFVGCVLGAAWAMEDGLNEEAQHWLDLATKLEGTL